MSLETTSIGRHVLVHVQLSLAYREKQDYKLHYHFSVKHCQCQWHSNTVNSEIFARTLFSRNFAYAKFRENKTLAKWRNHSVVY